MSTHGQNFMQHDQRLLANDRTVNSVYQMKSGVTVQRLKQSEESSKEQYLILKLEVTKLKILILKNEIIENIFRFLNYEIRMR